MFRAVRTRPEPLVDVAYKSQVWPSSRSNLYFVMPAAGDDSRVKVLKKTLLSMNGVAPRLDYIFKVNVASNIQNMPTDWSLHLVLGED